MRTISASFSLILFLTLPGLSDNNDAGKSAVASSSKQSQAALQYIKRLSQGEIDIAKHTALSEHCSIQRRKHIRQRLDFLKKNYFQDGDTLTVEAEKTDGELACVLIRAENPAFPLTTRIHAVALIKKADLWKAAPLPGLFANTGYGYDPAIEKKVRSLERWMVSEANTRETKSREHAASEFKSSLTKIENKAGFNTMDPEETVQYFIEQCRNKNLLAILASMGGASDALEDPMETTLNLITDGLNQKNKDSDWYLVTSRSVIAQTLKIDHTRNEVAIGFHNPLQRGRNQSKVLYFPTHKVDGKVFLRLSPMLKIAMLPENERWQQRWRHRRGDEEELRKQLPSTIFKNIEAVAHPTSRKLLDHFLEALKKDDFSHCLKLTPRTGEYFEKQENHAGILTDLSSFWRSIHNLKSSPRHTFDIIELDNLALAPLQYAKTNRTGEFQTIKVWMLKDQDGWHLVSPDTLNNSLGEKWQKTATKLDRQLLALEKERQDKHAKSLLDQVATITPPITLSAVPTDKAKNIFTQYREHLRAKDTQAALSSCAVLKGTNSTQTLKTFNYAIRGAADHTNYDHIVGTMQSGNWTAISVRTESKSLKLHDYPLYFILNTAKGPRVLLDIDLRNPTNKGRELLNKKNWRKLENALPKASLDAVKDLYQQHVKLTAKDVAEQIKLRE